MNEFKDTPELVQIPNFTKGVNNTSIDIKLIGEDGKEVHLQQLTKDQILKERNSAYEYFKR